MLCKGTFRCLLACLISCPHILPPNPPTINLQITSCGWQKQWRATCKQRSAPATGCESCCSHAGGRGERSRCGPLCLQRGGCCSLTSQPRARMDAPRLPNSSHSCLSLLPRRHGDGGAFRCDPHSKPLPCLNHSSICFPSACCSGGMGVDELSDAIRAAERYPSLAAEVEAARGLRERWRKRAEAQVGACLGTLVRTG